MMDSAITGIDHAIVGLADLEAGRERFSRLGFTPSGRGRHIGWGTANYCTMFASDYLELLGIVDGTQYDAGLGEMLADRGEGLLKLVIQSVDVEQTRRYWQEQGLAPGDVKDLARVLEQPEGEVRPEFRLVHPDSRHTPGIETFACQHLAPELVWQQRWMQHPNGATGLLAYTVVDDEPPSLAGPMQRLFGRSPGVRDDALEVATGGAAVRFVTPKTLIDRYPDCGADRLARPGIIAAATLRVAELGTAGVLLSEGGVAWARYEDRIVVPAHEACGVVLELRER